jgi:hypothetical protein
VLNQTPPAVLGSRSIHSGAMRGSLVKKVSVSPLQQSGLLFDVSQTKPLLLMSIEVTGPDGPGKVKPSWLLCATWSSPSCRLVPKFDSKQGA